MSFSILSKFSCTILYILMKTEKLLLFLAIHLVFSNINQDKIWNSKCTVMIWYGFCKATRTSDLYSSVNWRSYLHFCIVLGGIGKVSTVYLEVTRRTRKMNGTSLVKHFNNFLVQFVYEGTFQSKQFHICCFTHMQTSCRCQTCILCIYCCYWFKKHMVGKRKW